MKTFYIILFICIACLILLFTSGLIERIANPVHSPIWEIIVISTWDDQYAVNVYMDSDTAGYRDMFPGAKITFTRIVQ